MKNKQESAKLDTKNEGILSNIKIKEFELKSIDEKLLSKESAFRNIDDVSWYNYLIGFNNKRERYWGEVKKNN